MIEVRLYNNASDSFVAHKNISLLSTVQCDVSGECDIDTPELLLNMNAANLSNFNYCYIPNFERYYFCKIRVKNGNQMMVSCESDPLMSFWGSIALSDCIAERSSSNYNPELPDEMLPFRPQPFYDFRTLETGFNPSSSGGCYILTVGGK